MERSFQKLPPTHFVVINTVGQQRDREFVSGVGTGLAKIQKALVRKNQVMAYLRVIEWAWGGRAHAHLLVRWEGDGDPGALLRDVFQRDQKYRVYCEAICDVSKSTRYVVKHLSDPNKQPELTPPDFRGRVIVASATFLTKPFRRLWAEIQSERKEGSVAPPVGVAG